MTHPDRRRFLVDSLLAAAVAAAAPATTLASASASPKRGSFGAPIRIGVVGVRGRGRAHIKAFKNSPDAKVVALCEVDTAVLGPAQRAAPDAKIFRDYRKLLADPSIDAVALATPNHWHALGAGMALAAGKHVYVEKPISHGFHEGRQVIELAKKSSKFCQHGTQSRSYPATREAMAWLLEGGLGKVRVARGLCYKRRPSLGSVKGVQPIPKTLDYDLWTGPAEMLPLRRKSLHYDWHWDFNTGNGDLGNQGIHQLDIARWGLGRSEFPKAVQTIAGRVGYVDDGNTPNSLVSAFDYGESKLVFEVRGLKTPGYRKTTVGVVFECEKGWLASASYGKVVAFDAKGEVLKTFTGSGNHFQNFLDAIRADDPSLLHADASEGHLSSGLAHLGNISYLLGKEQKLESLGFDAAMGMKEDEALMRLQAHFAANEVDLSKTGMRVGPKLVFDPRREQFDGAEAKAANALLARAGRAPFQMPTLG